MVKKLIIYTLFLIYTDFFINIAVNFALRSPGEVIITSVILRAVFLFLFFPLIGSGIFFLLKKRNFKLRLLVTSIFVYALIPVIIYFLKSGPGTIFDVYIDFHRQFELYMVVFVPYILASLICILLSRKLKIF